MTHNSSIKNGKKYLYYQCTKVGHADRTACEIRRISARTLEQLMANRISFLARREGLIEKVVKTAIKQSKQKLPQLHREKNRLSVQLKKVERQAQPLVKALGKRKSALIEQDLKPLDEQYLQLKQKLGELIEEIERERQKVIDPEVVVRNFKYFDRVFDSLPFEKQRDLLHLPIREIVYSKDPSQIKISYYNLPEIETPPGKPKNGNSGGASNLRFDRRLYWLPRLGSNQGQAR